MAGPTTRGKFFTTLVIRLSVCIGSKQIKKLPENMDENDLEMRELRAETSESKRVEREARVKYYNQESYDREFRYEPVDHSFSTLVKRSLAKSCPCTPRWLVGRLFSFVPLLVWLPKYKWKKNLLADIVGGLTVAVIHLPQGMAYASLAGMKPIEGLYTSFFAQMFYMFFGTSRHVSMGVFAIVSLMAGAVRYRLVPLSVDDFQELRYEAWRLGKMDQYDWKSLNASIATDITAAEANASLTFAVGCVLVRNSAMGDYVLAGTANFQLLMAVLHLEMLTAFLSDQVVAGFTTGAAVHVCSAQVNKIMGIPLPRYNGFIRLYYMWRDFAQNVQDANLMTIMMAIGTLMFLIVGKEFINPVWRRISKIPLPWEFFVVLLFTGISAALGAGENYYVYVLKEVPTGLPTPVLPRMDLVTSVIGDAVGIAATIFVIELSLCKVFAKKYEYKVDAGQELYALGFMELLLSMFKVWPGAASIARTVVLGNSGSKTQLATVFSCGLLFIVIQWVGPFFEPLPLTVLGALIIFSLKGLFMQFGELPTLWKVSKTDFFIWIVSFLAPVILDVREGLAATVVFTLLTVVFRTQKPRFTALGRLGKTEHFEGFKHFKEAENPAEGIVIFAWEFPLIFTNAELFKEKLYEKCDIELPTAKKYMKKERKKADKLFKRRAMDSDALLEEEEGHIRIPKMEGLPDCVMINCTPITQIDAMGLNVLKSTYTELEDIGVVCCFAGCNPHVRSLFEADPDFYKSVPHCAFYPSLMDALHCRTGLEGCGPPSNAGNGLKYVPS